MRESFSPHPPQPPPPPPPCLIELSVCGNDWAIWRVEKPSLGGESTSGHEEGERRRERRLEGEEEEEEDVTM